MRCICIPWQMVLWENVVMFDCFEEEKVARGQEANRIGGVNEEERRWEFQLILARMIRFYCTK